MLGSLDTEAVVEGASVKTVSCTCKKEHKEGDALRLETQLSQAVDSQLPQNTHLPEPSGTVYRYPNRQYEVSCDPLFLHFSRSYFAHRRRSTRHCAR